MARRTSPPLKAPSPAPLLQPLPKALQERVQRLLEVNSEVHLAARFGLGKGTLARGAAGMRLTEANRFLIGSRIEEQEAVEAAEREAAERVA